MIRRHLEPALLAALSDTPAVFLAGPRQVGKSTLARALSDSSASGRRYLTFDDAAVQAAAAADPQGFLGANSSPLTLDEVQRVPAIFRALKLAIDRDRRPGRFLLTGSADPLLVPTFADALAGRIEILTLWGFSQGELVGEREGFLERLWSDAAFDAAPEPRERTLQRALAGGYPEVLERRDEARRRDWFTSYVATLLARDVRDLAHVEGLATFPRLLALLAAPGPRALNAASLGRDAGVAYATLRRYLTLLEALHLVRFLPAWSGNATSRLVKAPKALVTDPALTAHLAGWTRERIEADASLAGPLLESLVGAELLKQTSWSRPRARLHWFRTQTGREVDFVLESDDGRIAGIEVKTGATLGESDLAGLRALAAAAPRRFHRGVVLYGGREALPFGEHLAALPIATLWKGQKKR